MKSNVIDKVIKWNKDRNLDKKEFNLIQEVSYLYSEILELSGLEIKDHDKVAYDYINKLFINNKNNNLTNEDIADGFGDIIIFSIGALLKLGFDPNKVIDIINQANEKKSSATNQIGKIVKSSNFIKPDLTIAKLNKK